MWRQSTQHFTIDRNNDVFEKDLTIIRHDRGMLSQLFWESESHFVYLTLSHRSEDLFSSQNVLSRLSAPPLET